MIPPPPSSTLFPYTTLFRSKRAAARRDQPARGLQRSTGIPHGLHTYSRGRVRERLSRFRGGIAEAGPHFENTRPEAEDRKSTRLNSSHTVISYAVFCLKNK